MAKAINRIIRNNNILSLTSSGVVAGLRLLTFMILARHFTKEEFGEWILFLSATGFVEMIRYGITRTAMVRFLSGAKENEKKNLIGSNWFIGLLFSVAISIILYLCLYFFNERINQSGYYYFFAYYPIMAFVNLSFNNSLTILQAYQKFGSILVLNLIINGVFFFIALFSYLKFDLDVTQIVMLYLGSYLLASLISSMKGWDGIRYFSKISFYEIKKIIGFGKFTLGTLIGSNLLKNADTIIIGLSPLGKEAVALYSIPLKLTEFLEIPLRSFTATAFPRISKASMERQVKEVKRLFYSYSGNTTILFIPAIIIFILFAPLFVQFLGGEKYLENSVTITIFQLFAIYGLIAPIEKFTGITLDGINKPKKNFYKVMLMALLNVIGDLIAVFYFESLILVAFVTIIFTIFGQIIGLIYLNYYLEISMREFYLSVLSSIKMKIRQVKSLQK